MEKNNDIQVNKVSKWEAAPESIKKLRDAINGAADGFSISIDLEEANEWEKELMDILKKVLDDYNELEAKYQEACGMISQYEEDNRKFKSELDIKTDECDALIDRVFKQDDEYTKLEAEHKKLQETNELCMKAHLRLCNDSTKLEAENKDLRMTCEPLKKVIIKLQDEYNRIATENAELRSQCKSKEEELSLENDYLRRERDRYIDLLDKLRLALEDKGIYCEWSEAAIKWQLYGKNKIFDELREHYEEELRIREKEKDEKDKLIDELNQIVKDLKSKNSKNIAYGYFNLIALLREQIETLKKEREELKTKNRSLQLRTNMMYACHRSTDNANRKMAKTVADFENKNEELNRKIEELTHENRVLKLKNYSNGTYGLTSKIEELKKENKELKATLAMCERDANAAKNLCDGIAFNAERARSKTPWFDDDDKEEK